MRLGVKTKKKRKNGRNGKMAKTLTVRIDEALEDMLEELEGLLDKCRSDIVRQAIIEFYEKVTQDPVQWDNHVSVEWRPPRWL